jgi:hypothetical protein
MLIYVSGPYSAETLDERERNAGRAMDAGRHILSKGHWPFIPHLTHYFDEWHGWQHGRWVDPETYMQWDFAILRRCDALLYLAPSPGADRELALARELSLPVYLSVDEVPVVQE